MRGRTYVVSARSCVRDVGAVVARAPAPVPVDEARAVPGASPDEVVAFRDRRRIRCEATSGWFAGWTDPQQRPLAGADPVARGAPGHRGRRGDLAAVLFAVALGHRLMSLRHRGPAMGGGVPERWIELHAASHAAGGTSTRT